MPETGLSAPHGVLLVLFAVNQEGQYFLAPSKNIYVCITGMGAANAANAARCAIAQTSPKTVITAGFAGGLDPKYAVGTVLYDEDPACGLQAALEREGAKHGRFYCHDKVVSTALEKAKLWKETGADAVEMESSIIRAICKEAGIPSATIRVISDSAEQDMPLDFNSLMGPNNRIDKKRLAATLLRRPSLIPALLKFQRRTVCAARSLGSVITEIVS